MASDSGIDSQSSPELDISSMSRTHQYRKVMKPLLERKRRARINKCLDELKDLMVTALQTEGESITKLEKADVLELTVRHLRKLKAQGGLCLSGSSSERFRSGFRLCMSEITRFVTNGSAGIDLTVSARLIQHLALCHQRLETSALPISSVVTSAHSQLSNLVASPPAGHLNNLATSGADPLLPERSPFMAGRVDTPRFSHPLSYDLRPVADALATTPRPSSAPATVVKAEVTVIPSEMDTAWRPW